MNLFDKCCAVLAFMLGAVFIILGALGVFFGSNAQFTLPPILGGLPLLVGWGVVRPIYLAWKHVPAPRSGQSLPPKGREVALTAQLRVAQDLACHGCGYNLRTLPAENACPECGVPVVRTIIRYEREGAA